MRKGWEIKKLSELFEVKSSSRVHQADWKTSGIPFYRAREVVKLAKDGFVNNELYISQELYNEFTKIKGAPKDGDIIVSAVGTLGQCYLVKKNDKFYFKDASVLWLENHGEVNSRFIDFAFKSDLIINQVMEGSMGATVGTLTISRAKEINVPIPSLSEQQEIVSILDSAFESIERVKSNTEQNLKNSIKLFDSYLKNIFENKGENWEIKKLREVCVIINGGTPDTSIPKFWDGENLWITPKDMGKLQSIFVDDTMRKITDEGLKNSSAKILPTNSIILSSRAPIGHLAINVKPISTNQGCKGLVPSNKLEYLFLYYFLYKSVDLLNSLGTGATFKELSGKKLSDVEIPIPPLDVQKVIIKKLKELSVKTKKLESKYQQKLNDLEELKKSILQKAFNGELKTSKISA